MHEATPDDKISLNERERKRDFWLSEHHTYSSIQQKTHLERRQYLIRSQVGGAGVLSMEKGKRESMGELQEI